MATMHFFLYDRNSQREKETDLCYGDVEGLLRVEQSHVGMAMQSALWFAFPAGFLLPSVQSLHFSLVTQALKEFILAVAARLPRLPGSRIPR